MVTKEQAMALTHNQEVHYMECKRHVGPRGGVKVDQEIWRVSGKCQTWKTRPTEFRLPIKHGLYNHGAVTESCGWMFHTAADCPLVQATESEVA